MADGAPISLEALLPAAIDVAARAERFAYLEWRHSPMTPESRAFIAQPGPRPWRGLLSPQDKRLIVVLEDLGAYEPPVAAKEE